MKPSAHRDVPYTLNLVPRFQDAPATQRHNIRCQSAPFHPPPQHDPHPILNPLAIPDKIPATADITFHTGVAARCGLDTPGAGTAAADW